MAATTTAASTHRRRPSRISTGAVGAGGQFDEPGGQVGEEVLEAGPGDLVLKPRGVAHAFWNAGDEPARLLELISPAGFEHYFRELAPLLAAPERDDAAIAEVVTCYRLDIDFTTVPTLAQRHHLRLTPSSASTPSNASTPAGAGHAGKGLPEADS